jgi:hypothetical protein
MRRVAVCVGALALVAASGAVGSRDMVKPCKGGQLHGIFASVPGSGAAGHISYVLEIKNVSSATCAVSGLPVVRLLDGRRRALPTRVVPARRGITAVLVTLRRGRRATATARFSPDVPGPGEPTKGPCERTARWLRLRPSGGGVLVVPVRPRTPVCEHGRLVFSVFSPR